MPKYNQNDQFELTEKNLGLVLDNYEISDFTSSLPKNGIENTTVIVHFKLSKYVLRIYRQNRKSVEEIDLELDFMDYLMQNNIPVPAVILNGKKKRLSEIKIDGLNWFCVLFEFIEGDHIKEYSENISTQLAKIQAKIHLLGMEFAQQRQSLIKPKRMTEIQPVPKIDLKSITKPEARDFIERAKSIELKFDASLPFGLNHMDMDKGNILVKNDNISAVLDFDDLAYTPSVVCLGYTLWDIFRKKPVIKTIQDYLYSYQKVRKLSDLELDLLPKVILFRHFMIGCLEIYFHGENGEKVEWYLESEGKVKSLKIETSF